MDRICTNPKPHVVILCSPGLGHKIPVLELGKRLVTLHNFDVTIFSVPTHTSPAETQLVQSSMNPRLFEIVELPPVDFSKLIQSGASLYTQLCVIMREIKPSLRSAILGLKFRPAALIVDLFGTESLALAEELDIPKYVYIGCNAWLAAFFLYAPVLDKEVEGEYVDQKEPIRIPGCLPLAPEDVIDPMLDRTDQRYSEFLRTAAELVTCDGILVNTWEELETKTIAAFKDDGLLGRMVKAPVYPVGPMTRPVVPGGPRAELLDWLDKQPKESVVYVSFGSGGSLSIGQMVELAWGLEMSKQRFIWVLRQPTVKSQDESYFTTGNGVDDISRYLPDGFLTRTEDVGFLVPRWAPQAEILGHPSIGAFISHCGWNSVLESITNAVPIIAWPLYAEQRLNTALLVEELGVAITSESLVSKGVIGREDIEIMIKKMMTDEEGIVIRDKVRKLKSSANEALSEGGLSYDALSKVAKEIVAAAER